MYFSAGLNTKYFCNIPENKRFAPLRIIYLFIKSLVNPFLDIVLTFSYSSYELFSFSSKSVFFTKLPISFLLAKFACANLAVKFPAVNFLNCGVVI